MSERRGGPLYAFSDSLCQAAVQWPAGYRQKIVAVEEIKAAGDTVRIKAEFFLFAVPPAAPVESTGGYAVPVELEEAVRTGLDIVQQPRTVPLEPDLSEWIDGSIKPTIEGVYERKYFSATPDGFVCRYALWDGATWHTCSETAHGASLKEAYSPFQSRAWRGLRHYPVPAKGNAS